MRENPWEKAKQFDEAQMREYEQKTELARISAKQEALNERLIQFICDQEGKEFGHEMKALREREDSIFAEIKPPLPGQE